MIPTESVGSVSRYFLLSKAARSLSLARVARLSDDEARATFQNIRWAATDGRPVCPRCECDAVYAYKTRHLFKCKSCQHQFSVTSGTIFASRKLPVRDYLLAIAIFVNGAKGHSALQLSRDLDCQYKTAFVMAHKIREALAAELDNATMHSEVEVDGAYFGGHVKPTNWAENRRDRRLAINQNGKRRVVVIMRERQGRTLPFVFKSEGASLPTIEARVHPDAIVDREAAAELRAQRSPVGCGWPSRAGRARTASRAPNIPGRMRLPPRRCLTAKHRGGACPSFYAAPSLVTAPCVRRPDGPAP